jgi:hypothetical protein
MIMDILYHPETVRQGPKMLCINEAIPLRFGCPTA